MALKYNTYYYQKLSVNTYFDVREINPKLVGFFFLKSYMIERKHRKFVT